MGSTKLVEGGNAAVGMYCMREVFFVSLVWVFCCFWFVGFGYVSTMALKHVIYSLRKK